MRIAGIAHAVPSGPCALEGIARYTDIASHIDWISTVFFQLDPTLSGWENGFGTVSPLCLQVEGDMGGDGDVDGADFLAWQRGEEVQPRQSPSNQLIGIHDAFPAHELYINQQQTYTHDPITNGNGLIDLFPSPLGEDINVNESNTINPPASQLLASVSSTSSPVDSPNFFAGGSVELLGHRV